MVNDILTPLQMRELFHIEFLRWFSRKIKSAHYAVKGVNLKNAAVIRTAAPSKNRPASTADN